MAGTAFVFETDVSVMANDHIKQVQGREGIGDKSVSAPARAFDEVGRAFERWSEGPFSRGRLQPWREIAHGTFALTAALPKAEKAGAAP